MDQDQDQDEEQERNRPQRPPTLLVAADGLNPLADELTSVFDALNSYTDG